MTGLRRADKEITETGEVEAVLREAEVGRLGTSNDGQPYVVPVNFAYRNGKIYFHGAGEGKKLREIAANPRVCFEVDTAEKLPTESPCDYSYRYRSVIASGEARLLQDVEERADALRTIVEKYAPGKGAQITPERMELSVVLPISPLSSSISTNGRRPVKVCRAFNRIKIPGEMAPPRYSFRSFTKS